MFKTAHAATDAAIAGTISSISLAYYVQWLQGLEAVVALGFALVIGYFRVRIILREWHKEKDS